MKKPLLATLGLAGACAACCAMPVLVPLVSGLSVAGLLGFDGVQLSIGRVGMALGLGIVAAFATGLGIRAVRSRNSAAACSVSLGNEDSPRASCGCDRSTEAAPAGGSV